VAALLLAACSSATKRPDGGRSAARASEITLFFITELKGTLEPCGCNSDPLGDIARTAAVIEAVSAERPVALFDGGSTLYLDDPIPEAKRAQAELTADAIARMLPGLELIASGLGPFDLPAGAGKVRYPRQAANVTAGAPVAPPRIVEIGGVNIGVFGVVDPSVVAPHGVQATDPAAAARDAIAGLRARGAELVVALAHMSRAEARKLARAAPGADLMVAGRDAPDQGVLAPEAVGSTFILVPGNRGQVLTRVDLRLAAGASPLVDAIGKERAAAEIARLDERIARLEGDLARWEKDPLAEQAFVARNREELASLRRDREALAAQPLRAPPAGGWFTASLVRIDKQRACDAELVAQKRALDEAIGKANLASAEPPAPPAEGKPGYSGIEECGFCHKAAVDFWEKTRHAGAWETLDKLGKQWNRDCIGCHVTGWQEPGGATLAANQHLRDVQCETCHGPASLHVDLDGKDRPRTVWRTPAQDLCATRCHTVEHSDTFALEPYLRDVLGPGHGEKLRARLGDGPTGRQLRSAALDKAGRELGANCPK
jgi:hypothetical protein